MSKFKPAAAFSEKSYVAIPLTPVTSDQVAAIGYDDATSTLAVTFTRGPGHIYHYPGVFRQTYEAFMAAESKGNFFGRHIKSLPFEKFPAALAQPAATDSAPVITLQPVVSSNVVAVGYDSASKTLAVQFKGGAKVYYYAGVEPELHQQMMAAESVGRFIGAHIVRKYDFTTNDPTQVATTTEE